MEGLTKYDLMGVDIIDKRAPRTRKINNRNGKEESNVMQV